MTLSQPLLSGVGVLLCWLRLPVSLPVLPAGQVVTYEYHFRYR